jgi:hypothetical protein
MYHMDAVLLLSAASSPLQATLTASLRYFASSVQPVAPKARAESDFVDVMLAPFRRW